VRFVDRRRYRDDDEIGVLQGCRVGGRTQVNGRLQFFDGQFAGRIRAGERLTRRRQVEADGRISLAELTASGRPT
jgi:hypothetical protein